MKGYRPMAASDYALLTDGAAALLPDGCSHSRSSKWSTRAPLLLLPLAAAPFRARLGVAAVHALPAPLVGKVIELDLLEVLGFKRTNEVVRSRGAESCIRASSFNASAARDSAVGISEADLTPDWAIFELFFCG